MPLQATSGAASYDAFGGGVPVEPNYIESCFSTYLYTGNSSTQTITNGIDLSTYGGLVWFKNRDNANTNNNVYDTNRGIYKYLQTNTTDPQTTNTNRLTAFNTTGFNIGNGGGDINRSPDLYVSWTFRKQPKFFDVVTYTGNGTTQNIAHNLGSVPGCIIVKNLGSSGPNWAVYHRSVGNTGALYLNTTNATDTWSAYWNNTTPTSTEFTLGGSSETNQNGYTYIAYLFAHNAGGFGLTGTDNVISCGSFTGNTTVNLGYEPQWIMIKKTNAAGSWTMWDTMRGWSQTSESYLYADLSNAESSSSNGRFPNATGFTTAGYTPTDTFIYIAIRRGPMKVPTDGTKVFSPLTRTGNGTTQTTTGLSFSPDVWFTKNRGNTQNNWTFDRLRGPDQPLSSNLTDSESTNTANWFGGSPIFTPTNTGFTTIGQGQVNTSSGNYSDLLFGRAPSFFDEVCYTGNSTVRTVTHNLGVAPEMMIVKNRSTDGNWLVYHVDMGNTKYFRMNTSDAVLTASIWNNTTPTSTVFSLGSGATENGNTYNYVWYGFATCAGVSKVGSYTGTGTLTTINCGFTGGARFILIKKTSGTSDWFVWDTARGAVSGTDPSLSLNTTAAEVNANSVYTVATGFQLLASPSADVNTNGASYIFLAIA